MPTLFRTMSPLKPVKPVNTPSQQPPNLLPYRDTNNQTVGYAAADIITGPIQSSNYDSDFEPLINSPRPELDEDSMMHFTATGRPMPGYKHSNLMSMGGDMHSLPQLLPRRYTDDSIIPAIVVDVIPNPKTVEEEEKKRARRGSFLKRLKGEAKKDDDRGMTKVIYMPRRDYLKWFARDLEGKYIGTEPYKQWDEDELEEKFKQYKPVVEKRRYKPPY
ncbi:hypothetical protein D0Z07_5721 [Hyphodiscus hymeniophilus]|uniref:Uncharacterized protein n=1 Tax=Hyphodiscus hymeniophilus TaxID=353542 RepID=A0A9P6VHL9_9HELO|nr:hypothetical protein D0Z07_5721 [Hyphodiscus hymeniophilus]